MKKRTSNVSRRIVSLLMSMVLTLTLVTPAAFAEGMGVYANGEDTTVTTPIGGIEAEEAAVALAAPQAAASAATGDQDWTAYEVKEDAGVYKITTPEELAWLAQTVNEGDNFDGKTVKLEQDIDLSELCYAVDEDAGVAAISWTPIGDATHAFAGMFDGNGHTIEGLHINETGSWEANTVLYKGLFGNNSGTIKNIIVTGNVTITNNEKGPSNSTALAIKGTGGIVGSSSGVIQSCGFAGTVKVQGYTKKMGQKPYVNVPGAFNGGVVGNGKAVNCWYYCTNTNGASPLGVFGSSDSVLSLSCCCNMTGTVAGTGEKIDTTIFSEAAVKVLNTYAFKNGLKLWGTDASEDSKPYPVFSAQDANDLVLVKVEPFVKNSELNGKVKLNDGSTSGVDAYLVAKDTEVKLICENDDAYYVTDNSKETYSKESLTKISVPYKANEGGKTVTLYYGTDAEFTASALEKAWYYQGNGFAIQTTIYTENGQQKTASAEEVFRLFAVLVNKGIDFRGKTVYLNENVNLNQISDWESIGTAINSFRGTFNGRNGSTYYTISGLNGDLFGVVNGIIQYVTIDGGAGRLVGTLESGTVQYCMSTAEVTGSAGGLVGRNSGTVNSCYYYNAGSKNIPAVGGSSDKVTKCFYLADTSTFGAKSSDNGARTAEEFKLGRVAYELGGSSYVWVYDTTNKEEKMPQLGRSSGTMAVANELKLTKPDNQPEGVVVTLGNDSDKKTLTDAAGNQYYYAASGYPPKGVSDVPVTFTAPKGYQIVFTPATTKVDGKDYLRITGSDVEYTYSLVKADIRWYESARAEKNYVLKSADELMGFCLLANGSIDGVSENFIGWTLSLGNSIDLENSEWKPIRSFAGAFDGKGYEITGLNVNYTGGDFNSKPAGMFEKLDSTGKILNLAVSGSVQADDKINYVGGIVGMTESGSEIRFCRSNIAVKVDAANSTTNGMAYGGVAGKVQGAISNCLNEGTITVDNIKNKCYIGGVAGQVGSASAADLCWNTGSVTASSTANKNIYTGGIVGYGAATNCYNNGSVTGATDKNKYVTGGISGSGAVANSYNLGDVTGAKGRAYGISSVAATNSYYVCKLNGAEAAKYVNSNDEQDITTAEKDGKTVYKVSDDVLVDVLNKDENRGTYIEWINKQDAPYNPVHIKRWDGSFEPGVEGVATIVYDPNGGDGQQQNDMKMVVGNGSADFTVKSADEVGFRHENGTFLGWSTDPRAKTADNRYAAGKTVSVEKDKTVTLYAVWENIWTGSGTEADAYQISNAADLTALQTQVNENGFSYTGKWFRLTNNIDLNNELWTPIGVDALHSFGGSLDGSGKTISGLKVETDRQWAGLFGSVRGTYGVPMTMRDLTLKDGSVTTTFTGTSFCGGLVAIVEGETALELRNVVAENLTVSGGISGSGGLLGRGRVAMTNCHNRGGSVTGSYAGGLAGMGYSNPQDHVLAGCTNSAKVVGKRTAGGMTGNETHSDGSYTSCANSGSISATQGYASGIAAGGSYERCSNSGAVTGQQAAGICVNGSKATNCSNTGAVTGTGTGTGYAAGILTNDGYGGTVEFCWNTGSVEASTPVKAFGILYGRGAYNRVRNSFSYVPGTNIGLAPTELKEENVSDSYYLADKKDSVSSAGEWASADDFASGKVAWGVDGGEGAHTNYWTQIVGRGQNQMPAGPGRAYPKPIEDPNTEFSVYRALVQYGTGGTASLEANGYSSENQENAVYGMKGTSVAVTATPKDDTFGLKSLTLDLMGTGSTTALESGDSFTLGEANALVVAAFASTGNGGNGGDNTGGNGGNGDGSGTDTGDGAGDENDEGLQDGLNMDVEYNIKGLVLAAYAEWGANGGGKTFAQWLKASPSVLRAFITNSLDNMAAAAKSKDTDEAKGLAALLLASLNEHSGLNSKNGDIIGKALQRYMDTGSEATFSTWLTTGSGMASGTVEEILAQYTDSLLNLTERLYANWESSGTSLTFPQWLDAQQVTMESLSENAEEPDTDTDDTQTSEAPEDVPDGQEAEGGASGGGNSVWEVIGTVVRENPIIVWSIVAVVAALIIVGAVRRYHKVKRDERDDVASKK